MRTRLIAAVAVVLLVSGFVVTSGASGTVHEWSAPIDTSGGATRSPVAASIAPNGDAIISTSLANGIGVSLRRAGVWSAPIDLSVSGEHVYSVYSTTVADDDGRLYVVWVGFDNVTNIASTRVAVSHPGSAGIDDRFEVIDGSYTWTGAPTAAVDADGRLIVSLVVSPDNSMTRSVAIVRCDFIALPVCELPVVGPTGANVATPAIMEVSSAVMSVAWLTDAGDVAVVDIDANGIGQAATVASGFSVPDKIRGWSGNGIGVLQWTDVGGTYRLVRDAQGWGTVIGTSETAVDIAVDADGAFLFLIVEANTNLAVASSTDAVTYDEVHLLSTDVLFAFYPPSLNVASDGTVVAVWPESTGQEVMSAVRVAGAWQALPSLGTFTYCGGEPILANGSSDQAIVTWSTDAGASSMLLSEMILVAPSTTTTTTTVGDLTPVFAC